MRRLNTEKTRAIVEAECGIACYEGTVVDARFVGVHQGVCRDETDADVWLSGGQPETFVRVYVHDDDLS